MALNSTCSRSPPDTALTPSTRRQKKHRPETMCRNPPVMPKPSPWTLETGENLFGNARIDARSVPAIEGTHTSAFHKVSSDITFKRNFAGLIVENSDSSSFLGLDSTLRIGGNSGIDARDADSSGLASMERSGVEIPTTELGLRLVGPSLPVVSALTSTDTSRLADVNTQSHPGANVAIGLGCMHPFLSDCKAGSNKAFGAVDRAVPANDMGVQLRLSVAGCSSVVTESKLRSVVHEQQAVKGNAFDEAIPLLVEGSTPARSFKSLGYTGCRLGNVPDSKTDEQEIMPINGIKLGLGSVVKDNVLETVDDLGLGLVSNKDTDLETNHFINFAALSGTTSTISEASGGLADRVSRMCKFRGCGKGARGASGLCITHGGGRRCQKQGCNRGAEGRTVYCKSHGGGRRCQSLGCTKSAEGKTEYCIGHGGGRRCSHSDCTKAARGRSGLCIRHGGGKRCKQEGCAKSAEGYSGLCISHGGGRRCESPGCGKGAQGSTLFCKAHGGGKRCMIQGCSKGAEGSTPLCKGHGGGKRCMFDGGGICSKSVHGGTSYCVAHGGGKRCTVLQCTKSARGKTNFCVRHGGGKRCKSEKCTKSAQGSTDFCKAHGGGKRCAWGREGSPYFELFRGEPGNPFKGPCDRFARGKVGFCAAHSALVQERRVRGGNILGQRALPAGIGPGLFRGLVMGPNEALQKSKQSPPLSNDQGVDPASDCGEEDSSVQQACPSGENPQQERVGEDIMVSLPAPRSMFSAGFPPSVWPGSSNASSHAVMSAADFSLPKSAARREAPVYYRPYIPPQVLVPLSMRNTGQFFPSHQDESFATTTTSLPDERVHGGSLMSLLTEKHPQESGKGHHWLTALNGNRHS